MQADYWMLIALVAGATLIGAWQEFRARNARDATLMAALGFGGLVASASFGVA